MTTVEVPRWANGVRELLPHYDLFLIDQYGVAHDGLNAYPGVATALAQLAAHGKHAVLLTNSGRPAHYNAERVASLGVPVEHLDGIITSGDVGRAWLAEHHRGARCVALTSRGGSEDLEAAGVVVVDHVADAELLLVFGLPVPAERLTEASYASLLDAGVRRGLTLVCCNPDVHGIVGEAVLPATGVFAQWYRQRGGRVRYFGKPHPEVFEAAMRSVPGVDAARTILLGDMPDTDLAGAEAAGIAAAFVLGGVHRGDTSGPDQATRCARAMTLIDAAGTRADWLLSTLHW